MRVTRICSAVEIGRRPEMQDIAFGLSNRDSHYLAVFDGHGNEGDIIAQEAAQTTRALLEGETDDTPAADTVRRVQSVWGSLHKRLESDSSARHSGTTASLAVIRAGQLSVASLGDSESAFYPDTGRTVRLTRPHNGKNKSEVQRVANLGYDSVEGLFGNALLVSRAIGDHEYRFVSAEAEIRTHALTAPGTLLLATDGVWGTMHDEVERYVRSFGNQSHLGELAMKLTRNFSKRTHDNASAVLARIE